MLETKIDKLTAAIEKLNANIERALNTPVAPTVAPEQPSAPTVAPEQPIAPEAVTLTFKDVQDKCLAATRVDLANKAKIRALLDEFGASKVSDLGERLSDFAAKLEQL